MNNANINFILATGLSFSPKSAPDRRSVYAVALKLSECWADNAHGWFAQTEAQFASKGITCSQTKLYYCVAALGRADTVMVDLIEYPPDELLYEDLKEPLTELHTLNLYKGMRNSCPSAWLLTRSPPS